MLRSVSPDPVSITRSLDDTKCDYSSLDLGAAERGGDVAEEEVRDSIRLQKLFRKLQRQVHSPEHQVSELTLITSPVQGDTQRNEFFIFPPISIKFAVLPLCTKCTQLSIIDSETSPLAKHGSLRARAGNGEENTNVSDSAKCKVETFRQIKLEN